jgi:membrane-associated phospholipid phosphatase
MSDVVRSRYLMLVITILAYAIMFPLAWSAGMRIEYYGMWRAISIAPPLVIAAVLCGRRGSLALRAAFETTACGLLLTIPALVAVYLAMRINMPLVDNALAAADRGLGIDWETMVRFVDARPLVADILLLAYTSFGLQLMVIPCVLAISGHMTRAYRMVSAYGALTFISCLISIRLPAFGTISTFAFDTAQLHNLNPYFWSDFVDQLHGIRERSDFVFRLEDCKGILTFPSVHAALAVLFAWAVWESKLLRYPALLWNILVIISAFIIANHYVIDVIAGTAVGAVSIGLVCFATKSSRRQSTTNETFTQLPSCVPGASQTANS